MKKEAIDFIADVVVNSLKEGWTSFFGPCDQVLHPSEFCIKNADVVLRSIGIADDYKRVTKEQIAELRNYVYYYGADNKFSREELMSLGCEDALKKVANAVIEYAGGREAVQADLRNRAEVYGWDREKKQKFLDENYGKGVINLAP